MTEQPKLEIDTPEEIAEILLNNSLNEREYRENLVEVVRLGVDPLCLNHEYLDRTLPWQRAESHQDILLTRRRS